MSVVVGISVDDWDRLEVPEGYRAEVIAGELVVSPSGPPGHGAMIAAIIALLVEAAPPDLVVLADTEWQVASNYVVAAAPRPDVLVVRLSDVANVGKLTAVPLLAVEVLSQSDFHALERAQQPRIEAKRRDYANNGLQHYLEVTVSPERVVHVDRYELEQGRLVVVATATGPEVLEAGQPFAYRIVPEQLLPF